MCDPSRRLASRSRFTVARSSIALLTLLAGTGNAWGQSAPTQAPAPSALMPAAPGAAATTPAAPQTTAPAAPAAPQTTAPAGSGAASATPEPHEPAASSEPNPAPGTTTTEASAAETAPASNSLASTTSAKDDDSEKSASAADAPGGAELPSLNVSSGPLKLGFGARVIGGWEYGVNKLSEAQEQRGERDSDFGFFLSQARFTVDGSWGKALSLQLDLDFSSSDPLKDAWLNFKVSRPFQVRVGQFKRAYSRLELMGAGKLPLRSRGLANDQIVSELGYGGRSIGVEFWGRLKKLGLEWTLGASDTPSGVPGVDLHARLAYEPSSWLEVGAGAVHKIAENRATIPEDFIAGNGFGFDLDVHGAGTHVLLDALIGENLGLSIAQPDPLAVRNNAGSLGLLVSHDLELTEHWALQPVVFGEWVDSNLEYSRSEAVRAVAGVNALWNHSALRVMPQVELIRPLRTGPVWTESTTFYVLASAEL